MAVAALTYRAMFGLLLLLVLAVVSVGAGPDCTKTQVFIDTDIGTDFDDSVAIAYALKSPTLEVCFILTATGDVLARTKVAAKYLQLAGLDYVPLGVGLPNQNSSGVNGLFTWAQDYDLSDYKGGVFLNGTEEMGRRIVESPCKDVVILEIAPASNMPYLLSKYPVIAKKARVKAMAGSIHRGYDNSSTPTNEYNVKTCPKCMRELFQSGMNVTITPLDTCGVFRLDVEYLRQLLIPPLPLPSAIVTSWTYWCTYQTCTPQVHTDVFFDVVGAFLTHPDPQMLLNFQLLKIWVTDDGYTVVDDAKGTPLDVALTWKDNGLQQLQALFTAAVTNPAL